jgi:hypothetical protein
MNWFLARRGGDPNAFFQGLSEGDPVAWCILGGVVLFTAFGAYQKFRSF